MKSFIITASVTATNESTAAIIRSRVQQQLERIANVTRDDEGVLRVLSVEVKPDQVV